MTTPNQSAPDGAFVIGGGDYTYGQDYTNDTVKEMFHIPFPTVGTAIDILQEILLKMPIEALRMFKDVIPGTVDDDFLNVLVAVDTIIDNIQDSPLFLTLMSFIDGPMSIVITVINLILDTLRAVLSFVGMSWLVPPDIVLS